jgi:hypothetical protein
VISVFCVICGNELDQPGALLITPPSPRDPTSVVKYHLCVDCLPLVAPWAVPLPEPVDKGNYFSVGSVAWEQLTFGTVRGET